MKACWCGARIVQVYAGRRLEGDRRVVTWERCKNGHATAIRRIPANLGSRR